MEDSEGFRVGDFDELAEALDYYGHGSGLFLDLRSMTFAYLDSRITPEEWVKAQGNMEGGGDITKIDSAQYPKYTKDIEDARNNPGKWMSDGRSWSL